ncbi:hypothetical protein PsorP6_003658 [Peronosclerospora sorghi]|uniref:Uncharacterized protein n=1 Tax=Peronosclerospora sorghi TaxID=230839 RepID=A0ACC0VQS2_9STRA|nr:hypothetical protein PsorP6_003658 [Peronosclerospora sorghi]
MEVRSGMATSSRAGYACIFPHFKEWNVAKQVVEERATNNRADYMAALQALKLPNLVHPERSRVLYIFSDSMILIRSMTEWIVSWQKNHWKRSNGASVQNRDLLELLGIQMHHHAADSALQLDKRLWDTNPILEIFGNAKTKPTQRSRWSLDWILSTTSNILTKAAVSDPSVDDEILMKLQLQSMDLLLLILQTGYYVMHSSDGKATKRQKFSSDICGTAQTHCYSNFRKATDVINKHTTFHYYARCYFDSAQITAIEK